MKKMKIYAIRRGHVKDDDTGMPIPTIFIKADKDSEEIPLSCYDESVLEKGLQNFLKHNDVESFDSNSRYDEGLISNEEIDEIIKIYFNQKIIPQFRLPTKEEFENLISSFSRWNEEKGGIEILSKRGEILFLPSKGYYYYNSLYQENELDIKNKGYYWSSTIIDDYKYYAYALYFDPIRRNTENCCVNVMRSVRLVSDTPFEGGIEFGGVYWKTENEDGYYIFNEAMEKFNR